MTLAKMSDLVVESTEIQLQKWEWMNLVHVKTKNHRGCDLKVLNIKSAWIVNVIMKNICVRMWNKFNLIKFLIKRGRSLSSIALRLYWFFIWALGTWASNATIIRHTPKTSVLIQFSRSIDLVVSWGKK